MDNFPLRGQPALGEYPALIKGLIHTKQAAAGANLAAGGLDESIANAILAACRKLLAEQRYEDDFPIHALHGGGGTSANMNANEVLANLAEEILGGKRGRYERIHPNDHVNLNQSTNDVYPTACHVAVIGQWPKLAKALAGLGGRIDTKGQELRGQLRIARTCLQDAVPTSFADLLGGYSGFLARSRECIGRTVGELHAVNLGGTIVGRAQDLPAAYFQAVVPALCEATGDPAYRRAENLFDAAQNLDDLVRVSAELDLLAHGLIKICRDLRLLSSGPEAGLHEIILPAVQAGSSVMPGKVNPVIPEHAIALCFKAMGAHAACRAALDHGELDLNVWESVVVCGVLDSMQLLQAAADALAEKCIGGLQADSLRNDRNVGTIMPLLTELVKRHGYSRISRICTQAGGDLAKLRRLLKEAFAQ